MGLGAMLHRLRQHIPLPTLRELWEHKRRRRGREGENAVARRLRKLSRWRLPGRVLQNVYVPRPDGTTAEIDLLYLTRKGIFVLESKNYTGWIYGAAWQKNWTVCLYRGRHWWGGRKVERHPLYNPVWQNRTHLHSLRRYLGEDVPLFSVVVFTGDCALKRAETDQPDTAVCTLRRLSRTMCRLTRWKPRALSQAQLDALADRLTPLTHASAAVRRQHTEQARRAASGRRVCPVCGAKLVLRTAQRGPHAGEAFYGCSRYPRCTYTRPR